MKHIIIYDQLYLYNNMKYTFMDMSTNWTEIMKYTLVDLSTNWTEKTIFSILVNLLEQSKSHSKTNPTPIFSSDPQIYSEVYKDFTISQYDETQHTQKPQIPQPQPIFQTQSLQGPLLDSFMKYIGSNWNNQQMNQFLQSFNAPKIKHNVKMFMKRKVVMKGIGKSFKLEYKVILQKRYPQDNKKFCEVVVRDAGQFLSQIMQKGRVYQQMKKKHLQFLGKNILDVEQCIYLRSLKKNKHIKDKQQYAYCFLLMIQNQQIRYDI